MSYKNFIPTIWAEEIQRELERSCVFAEDCNRQYEGKVTKAGDSVRILGVGKPTITNTTGGKITLGDPEEVESTSVVMQIDTTSHYIYSIDDIDKRQSVGGVMEALSKETSEGVANEIDSYIAKLALSSSAKLHSAAAVKIDTDSVLLEFDKAIQMLYENDVAPTSKITATVTPRFYFILKRAFEHLDTSNSDMIKNGKVGRYGNVAIKMSNNVATNTAKTEDKIMLRTDRAIAFANPMVHIEPFRPEKSFSDAVKGFVLYGAKIVRPKEMVIINAKYA